MSSESNELDPYAVVLADLYAKRDQIAHAIQALEGLRGGATASSPIKSQTDTAIGDQPDTPGWLLGLSIPEAAKKVLAARKRALGNAEIWAAFQNGGLALQSAEPLNTIGSVLTRRFNTHGDIVRVSRGQWGLAEWYPGRSFKKKAQAKPDGQASPSPLADVDDILG